MTVAKEFFNRIFDSLSDKPLTTYQISYATGLDPRTVRSYLSLIELVQSREKIMKEIIGSRVVFRK
ncbi:hypothetical protein KKG55_00415 [Candidatus Micrarchaeota archaeon]|nr:hypothetical protein [Candidatus Micrarchaeota archaeon]